MAHLTPHWNGSVFGTNTGKLNLEFTQQGDELKATLRFMDEQTGVVEYKLEGTRDENDRITLDGTVSDGYDEQQYGVLHMEGNLTADNTMRGNWRTSNGTGGNYLL